MNVEPLDCLLIRADATVAMGTGHIMRCLALAQAWQDTGHPVVFACGQITPALEARIASERMQVVKIQETPGSEADAKRTLAVAASRGAKTAVVDGYHFGASFQRSLRREGLRLLALDDYGHCERYHADFVLNQNLGADESLYAKRDRDTRLLLGTTYALLRREFLRRTAWQREIPRVAGNILVTLGGSDPDNVTKKAVDALRYLKHRDLNVAVVIGGSNSHGDELAAGAGSLPGVRLLRDVEKLSDLMMWADVAVGASGATSWERAAMGLPTLAITVAENQRMVAAMLAEHGAAASLGWHAALSPEQIASQVDGLLDRQELRRSMSAAGRRLVDGCGARRVVKHLQGKQLGLRPARWEDCRVVWEWSNDPEVRAFAFSSDHIAWDHHTRWFAEKLRDPACLFLIAEDADDVPVGQLRADLAGGEAELTVNVDPRCRGRGLGSAVIREGVGVLFSELPVDVAVALVRTENARSIRAFEKAGFAHKDRRTVQGHPAQRLVRTRQTESCGTDRSVA